MAQPSARPSKPRKRRIWRWIALVVAVAALAAFFAMRPEPEEMPDPELVCHAGAYRFDDGGILILGPSSAGTLRYRLLSGRSGRLYPAGDGRWEAGPYWTGREPVVSVIELAPCEDGTFVFTHEGAAPVTGRRMTFKEVPLDFESHGLRLRGKVVLPEGEGPFPTVVLVHGSNRDSAVAWNAQQYIFPAQGVAALVYDKRGTGESDGEYSQDFHLLSDDAVAALAALRERDLPQVRSIGLAGFSQGGWVAPLAATKAEVDFVIAAFGMAESPLAEDRDEALRGLIDAGYGPDDLAKAREVLSATGRVMASRFEEGMEELAAVKERYSSEPWFDQIEGEFSGDLLRFPGWMARSALPFFDVGTSWDYDPLPALETIEVPHLWIVGGRDLEAPPERTLEIVGALASAKPNLELEVFDQADHGILVFEEIDGERRYTGHAPGYLELLGSWILEATAPVEEAALSTSEVASAG